MITAQGTTEALALEKATCTCEHRGLRAASVQEGHSAPASCSSHLAQARGVGRDWTLGVTQLRERSSQASSPRNSRKCVREAEARADASSVQPTEQKCDWKLKVVS